MINKCFEFKDYSHKRSEPNYTTVADFYHYCDNQNNVLKSLADCLLWQPSTDYTVGKIVRAPGMPTGHIAKCTTAGKSSEEEPAWTDGAVTDGTAKWRVYDPESATDDKITTASSKKLDKIGGSITGPISYDGAPKTDIELVNKSYVLAAIKSALDERTKAMYPVGCYFYSDDSRAPSEYIPGLEGTTWEQTAAGRVLIGAGTADSGTVYKAGDKGGEEKHPLTLDESARHTHGQNINGNGNDGWKNRYGELVTLPDNGTGQGQDGYASPVNKWVLGGNRVYTSEAGGNKPHNNMQPYQVVYIFKRSA
ncbi:phage baseplate protein [Allisonella histaminiformans]|uniref:phage baseplate protein n=1 Tax=Allisonella histaminiformans TaxID=209880 RepID=UPI002E78910D|nr:hypothetical protein [Allisonella histaminiformans]